MNITKAIAKQFVEGVKQGLIDMGAKLQPQCNIRTDVYEFKLDTIVGNLDITLRQDQSHLFMIASRFDDVDKAKHKFTCNKASGKYNYSSVFTFTIQQEIDFALSHFECTLPKEIA
jgi:hypothetical protein